jgi:hypothetical protein
VIEVIVLLEDGTGSEKDFVSVEHLTLLLVLVLLS